MIDARLALICAATLLVAACQPVTAPTPVATPTIHTDHEAETSPTPAPTPPVGRTRDDWSKGPRPKL